MLGDADDIQPNGPDDTTGVTPDPVGLNTTDVFRWQTARL